MDYSAKYVLALMVAVILWLSSSPSLYADQSPPMFGNGGYCGISTKVLPSGRFRINGTNCRAMIDDYTELRLFGVMPNPEALNDLIEGKRINCSIRGISHAQGGTRTEIVSCTMGPINGVKRGRHGMLIRIGEYLLMIGEAVEICGETQGRMGTCEESWWPRTPVKP